jgi:hypothetical protein
VWSLLGKTPYGHYAKKYGSSLATESEIKAAYNWAIEHFKIIHINDRTPAGIIEAFTEMYEKHQIDGFMADPWKSVKQNITSRSDIWLEDTLMEFKKFSMETNSIMNFVVHPKSMRDYRDEDGNFRIITPFDLNGGAAWNNSMDVIISLRRTNEGTEWHSQKIRKQHLVGKPGMYEDMTFDMNSYRFGFGGMDVLKNKFVI